MGEFFKLLFPKKTTTTESNTLDDPNGNSSTPSDPFRNCNARDKEECLADIQKVRDNDPNYTQLNWGHRKLGADGAKVLAEALKKNSSVTFINLYGNKISDDGAKAIAEALGKNLSVTNIYLDNNEISTTNEALIQSKIEINKVLDTHQWEVQKNYDETKPLESLFYLCYYIDGFSATSSPSLHDNKPQWKWTSAAWEAVNQGDGRVAQVLLECLKEDTNSNSNFRESLKRLVETDFNNTQSLLHIAAGQPYHKILELLKFFVEDCEAKIDLTDEEGRSIREIAIGNKNSDISAWARKFGTYLNRYRIEGGNGLDSEPVHESPTCVVHFATDMDKVATDPDYEVALKIMFEKVNFERELQARVTNDAMSIITSGDDISMEHNMYESEHVVPLYRYHNDATDKNSKQCWCLVLKKGLKSIHTIIDSERIAGNDTNKLISYGNDFAEAIKHMHEKNMVHADIKPRNVIRDCKGDLKLIDLDASVKVGSFLTEKKKSTAFISPEVAKIVFQPKETLIDLENDLKEKINKRNELEKEGDYSQAHDLLTEDIKVLGAKSKFLKENKWIDSSNITPSIPANVSLDIWGFGVTMYPLFTNKKYLFKSDLADDTLDGEGEEMRLVDWNGPSAEDLKKILPGCDELIRKTAKAFFKKCLHRDVQKRFKSMDEVIEDPLFQRANDKDGSRDMTGLLNQETFQADKLEWEFKAQKMLSAAFAIDVANFKSFNDNLSHEMGNIALKIFALQINECAQTIPGAKAYHSGGDEFQVLAHHQGDEEEFRGKVTVAAKKLSQIDHEKNNNRCFLRIGVACFLNAKYEQADEIEHKVKKAIMNSRGLKDRETAYEVKPDERYLVAFKPEELK